MADDWGLLDKDGAADPICPSCEQVIDWECCYQCDGMGIYGHDCGEDCCACLEPEDNEPCDECNGAGGWHFCPNPQCKQVLL